MDKEIKTFDRLKSGTSKTFSLPFLSFFFSKILSPVLMKPSQKGASGESLY